MLLTIAIPAHNKASYLKKAVKSIIKDDEFGKNINIVISDNSNNPDIKNLYYKEYVNNKKLRYYSSKKYNCLDSNVNRSIELANGKYVWVFGDDDILITGILKKILQFLKTKNPNLLICNSKSFAKGRIIESSRMPNIKNSFYEKNENDKFLIDMAGYLTSVSTIIVKRELWISNYNKNKIGSFFAHIDCVASIKNNNKVDYFKIPAIKLRLGSQTWLNKTFKIWYLYYPEIIWGLENYSFDAKQKIIPRFPLNSLKLMLSARAYRRINFKIFKKYILKSNEVHNINKFLIFLIAILPAKFFSKMYCLYITLYKKKQTTNFSPKLALAILKGILSIEI